MIDNFCKYLHLDLPRQFVINQHIEVVCYRVETNVNYAYVYVHVFKFEVILHIAVGSRVEHLFLNQRVLGIQQNGQESYYVQKQYQLPLVLHILHRFPVNFYS